MAITSLAFISCESDEFDLLQGTWTNGKNQTLVITEKEWKSYYTGTYPQSRIGTYTWDGSTIINVSIAAGSSNNAYEQTYIIKTLNDETLVFDYIDGGTAGSYVQSSVVILLVFSTTCASAQSDTISHVIERGESMEYLVERYNVSVDDIKNCNGSCFDLFYTGMEIRIPVPRRRAATHSAPSYNSYYASRCEQADALLNGGDYKKAIKAYSELIDSYSSSLPCTEAYYGRALAYYNRGKWKSAIKDFEVALNDENLSSSTRSQCKNLLSKARTNREQQLEERGQMWGCLFAAAAVTTAAVVSASNTPNNSGDSYPSGVSSSKTGNMNYRLDPNYTVQQVNAQNEAEYQQAKRFNPSLTKEQFMQMKTQAWQATRQATSGVSSSSSGSYTQSSSSSSVSCPQCHGLGKCWTCNGNRRYLNSLTGKYVACPNCTNGLCRSCGGTGKK